jgi:ribonuclease H-related protein
MARKEYFAIVKGAKTGVFPGGWDHARPLVAGHSGARYKGFATEMEAEHWFETHSEAATPPARGGLVAYVDGSNRSDGSEASWAYVLCEEDSKGAITELVDEEYGVVGESDLPPTIALADALSQRNILGECLAAIKAVQAIAALPVSALPTETVVVDGEEVTRTVPVTVFHDYEGLGLWATLAWRAKNPLTQHYARTVNPYVRSGLVQFRHVKGHTGVEGNERADRLAGWALGR